MNETDIMEYILVREIGFLRTILYAQRERFVNVKTMGIIIL